MTKRPILERLEQEGVTLTGARRVVAQVLERSTDHPDVEQLFARVQQIDPAIPVALVFQTVKLFEDVGILDRRDFGDGRMRYEDAGRAHHDHLIDLTTGAVVEFVDPEIEALQVQIARRLGYRLQGHRLELYGTRLKDD